MSPIAPRILDCSIAAAQESAVSGGEPVFVPVSAFTDDRGWSMMNLFRGVMSLRGQINVSVQYPGVVKAWHRHEKQVDFWLCFQGHIKVGVCREEDGRLWRMVVGEKNPGVMVIPRLLWHGLATVGHEPAGLLYYVTEAYNPEAPDEQRRAFDSVEGFSWGVEHR